MALKLNAEASLGANSGAGRNLIFAAEAAPTGGGGFFVGAPSGANSSPYGDHLFAAKAAPTLGRRFVGITSSMNRTSHP